MHSPLHLLVAGPFDYNGVSHMFYQYCPNGGGQGPGPGGHLIRWGHVAGNLSHWFDFYFLCVTFHLNPSAHCGRVLLEVVDCALVECCCHCIVESIDVSLHICRYFGWA